MVAGVALLGALTGCAGSQDGSVVDAVTAFYAAYDEDDGQGGCVLLAPRTRTELESAAKAPCATALLDEDLPGLGPTPDVRVFGAMAQVHTTEESVFLTRLGGSWRIWAAGCTPPTGGSVIYDCAVSGG